MKKHSKGIFNTIAVKFRYFTELVGDAVIPKKYRKSILQYLEKASVSSKPYFGYGLATYGIIILSIVLSVLLLNTRYFGNLNLVLKIILSLVFIVAIFIFLTVIVIFFYRLYVDLLIYRKTREMEEVFPEFLAELSLNLKAGLSLEEAMENSLEKEYGHLNEEIEKVTKKVALGDDIETAIKEFTSSFKSYIIEETFDLIIISWKKGANTAKLIDRIYDNIEVIRYLKKRVVASVTGYRIFLSIITLAIAPAMFALAYHLIDLIRKISDKFLETAGSTYLPIILNPVMINDQHFMWFLVLSLVVVAMVTAMIISIIKNGTVKEGFKQIVIYAVFSYFAFLFFMFLFSNFFALFKI